MTDMFDKTISLQRENHWENTSQMDSSVGDQREREIVNANNHSNNSWRGTEGQNSPQ